MREVRCALAAALLTLAAAGCGGRGGSEPIRFGHLTPLSGPDRVIGEHARQGVELAVDEWNADPANGRKVVVLHVDARGEDMARAEAVRLLSVNRVAALLAGPEAAAAEGAARVAGRYDAAVVATGELAAPPEGVFAVGPSPAQRGRALARYASHDLTPGGAAVLAGGRDPVAGEVASAFRQAWPQRGDRGSALLFVYGKDADLAARAAEAAKSRPGVVLIAGPPADLRPAAEALNKAGLTVPLLYGGADYGPGLGGEAPGAPNVLLATAYAPEGLTPAGQALARRYEERFHTALDLPAALAYDGTRLLLAALRQGPGAGPGQLRAWLAKREPFESVTGPLTWKDGQPLRRLFLVSVANDRPKFVKEVAPD